MNNPAYHKNAKISVIMPVYNAEKYLKRSVESVINQTYKNIELILVNDASTDSSLKLCEDYALADNRIKVFSNINNGGPAMSRNNGIKQATGEYIFFIDADDYIELDTFETLITEFDKADIDLVMSNFSKLIDGKVIKQNVVFNLQNKSFKGAEKELSMSEMDEFVRHFLKYPSSHLISYCWARLFKRSIIADNNILVNENMRLFEDLVFHLKYLQYCRKVLFINQNLYIYAIHDTHISASMNIINADSLLHDMALFDEHTREYFLKNGKKQVNIKTIEQEIGHAIVHYVIIFLIRSCRLITADNKRKIYAEISKLINSQVFRKHINSYKPSKGNSRMLPVLMKLKFVKLMMHICQRKAFKRYGRLKGA